MRITVLGSAAGGGFPQWNCNCANCSGLRNGTLKAKARTQSSIFIRPGTGEASGEASCQFDASTAQLSCRTALGRTGEITINEFASLSDFIEAGRSPGKVTSLSEVRTLGRREIVTRHEYDELGRLILRREARPEGDIVYTYADFDESGRPRSAQPTPVTLEQWGCSVAPMTIEYGDVRVRYQYRPAAGCGNEYSVVERFDGSGNLVQVDRFSPAGVETLFEASAPVASQLLCD